MSQVLEIIHRRYGAGTHTVFVFFALLTNVLVASQLLLGGSAVVSALTGIRSSVLYSTGRLRLRCFEWTARNISM